jgi:hypothetical protein
VALAYISWRWVERPFRDKNKVSRKMLLITFICGLLAFQAIGYVGYKTYIANGFSSRVQYSEQLKESFKMSDANQCFSTPFNHSADDWGCNLGAKKSDIDFILFGDSHSLSLKNTIDEVAKSNNISIFFTGSSGCIPFLEVYPSRSDQVSNSCNVLNARVAQFAKTNNVKGIILSARWSFYTQGDYDGRKVQFISKSSRGPFNLEESISSFEFGFNQTVNFYNNVDIPIYLFSQPPQQKYPAEIAYFNLYKGIGDINKISIKRAEFEALENVPKSIIAKRINDINYFNIIDIFCDTKVCPIGTYEKSFYADADHLSMAGAEKLFHIFEEILQ